MISKDVLTRKGSIDALLALSGSNDLTAGELSEAMSVADGTARDRMEQLIEEGHVSMDASLRDSSPVRVYTLTEEGQQLANSLGAILNNEPDEPMKTADSDDA